MGELDDSTSAEDIAAPRDPLAQAIAKQEQLLKSVQGEYGEFHPSVSDDLAQLALLRSLRGEYDKALTLLHKRLVIHEKHGPPERIGEALHALGTTYRLQGTPELALQHLERALATQQDCHGATSPEVAETLNSIALLHYSRNQTEPAEAMQLRSLRVLLEGTKADIAESKGGSAMKQVELLSALSTVPKTIDSQLQPERFPSESGVDTPEAAVDDLFFGADVRVSSHSAADAHGSVRSSRSKSESAMAKLMHERDAQDDLDDLLSSTKSFEYNDSDEESPAPTSHPPQYNQSRDSDPARPHDVYEPIGDAAILQSRVEHLKRRIVSGAVAMDMEIARFASDVELIASVELRGIGETMVDLVREMHRMRLRVDRDANQLPLLEGFLEKKSASIFRGWERRFFRVDAKTFILSYHYNKEDCDRGFAPRGGFSVARITNIAVHRAHGRPSGGTGPRFQFDVAVDLSTRLKPHAVRVYELRAESQSAMQHWVDMLQYYKARAQTALSERSPTRARPSAPPGTS